MWGNLHGQDGQTSRNRVSRLNPTDWCGMILAFPAKGAWFFAELLANWESLNSENGTFFKIET